MFDLQPLLITLARKRAEKEALEAGVKPAEAAFKETWGETKGRITALGKAIRDEEEAIRIQAEALYSANPDQGKTLAGGLVTVTEASTTEVHKDPVEALEFAKAHAPQCVTYTIEITGATGQAALELLAQLLLLPDGDIRKTVTLDETRYDALFLSDHKPEAMPGEAVKPLSARIASDLSLLLAVTETATEPAAAD